MSTNLNMSVELYLEAGGSGNMVLVRPKLTIGSSSKFDLYIPALDRGGRLRRADIHFVSGHFIVMPDTPDTIMESMDGTRLDVVRLNRETKFKLNGTVISCYAMPDRRSISTATGGAESRVKTLNSEPLSGHSIAKPVKHFSNNGNKETVSKAKAKANEVASEPGHRSFISCLLLTGATTYALMRAIVYMSDGYRHQYTGKFAQSVLMNPYFLGGIGLCYLAGLHENVRIGFFKAFGNTKKGSATTTQRISYIVAIFIFTLWLTKLGDEGGGGFQLMSIIACVFIFAWQESRPKISDEGDSENKDTA